MNTRHQPEVGLGLGWTVGAEANLHVPTPTKGAVRAGLSYGPVAAKYIGLVGFAKASLYQDS